MNWSNGVLVEKALGFGESLLAAVLIPTLREFVAPRNLGLVTGADGMVQLFSGLVRVSDVAFIAWESLPDGRVPRDAVPHLAPDLAVEVISRTNTPRETERKQQEYFAAGVKRARMVDPQRRTVAAFTSQEAFRDYAEHDTLDSGAVLPGFSLPLRELFAELDRQAN